LYSSKECEKRGLLVHPQSHKEKRPCPVPTAIRLPARCFGLPKISWRVVATEREKDHLAKFMIMQFAALPIEET
jgi:hypothetical protein